MSAKTSSDQRAAQPKECWKGVLNFELELCVCADDVDGFDLGEVILSLDKSANISSLMDALAQKLPGQFDAFASDKIADDDYEKQAEKLRGELKAEGMEERLIEVSHFIFASSPPP